jgi:site-specific recombinase XerD
LQTIRIHLNQMAESLGERFRIQGLTLLNLQAHVDRRSKKGIAPATIKKEIATTRACWTWAAQAGLLKGACPSKGL